jgi:hypothetical protein
MSISRITAALAIAGVAAFAPSAAASFPFACDTVQCFAEWCVNNAGDCTDDQPHWFSCRPGQGCIGGSGDITRYVAYCTFANSPEQCLS